MSNYLKIDSYPITIRFAGWESDTYRLQKAGWQIAASQVPEPWNGGTSVQLILRHERLKLHAITGISRLNPRLNPFVYEMYQRDYERLCAEMGLDVIAMGTDVRIQIIPMPKFDVMSFETVNCEPQMVDIKELNLADLKIFRPISSDAPEIIIPAHSVSEMMDLVLKLQDPVQKELRDKRRAEKLRGDWREAGYDAHADIKCQILAFG